MNFGEIKRDFDLVAYISTLVKLKKHGAYYTGPCPMCGGRDRFTVKRTTHDVWICRKCSDGKYHSSIDFIMTYQKIDLQGALQWMNGDTQRTDPLSMRSPLVIAEEHDIPSQDWQSQAWIQIDNASDYLFDETKGEAGRQYLVERGISRGSMYMWLLGIGTAYGRPAIYIPYLDTGDLVTAVKYRFIDDRARVDKGARFSMKAGSMPRLFGLQHIQKSDHTLLFVEGEINAISVLQTMPCGVSVVSAGSESNGSAGLLHALASRYERVVIWMDDPLKAITTRNRMGRDTTLLKSPIFNSRKWDANEMLKAGVLMEFIKRQLSIKCFGIPVEKN